MTQYEDITHDVIVIGSGPAGYTAAVYAARAGLSPLVFEGSVSAGGALMNTTEVDNFPGFRNGIMGPALMDEMRGQAERFGAQLIAQDIVSVELASDVKTVVDGNGAGHYARAVVLAMGSGYRTLGVDGEDRLSGRGVSWCATCDGFFFRGHDIAVVGGGDSAIEEAVFLSRFARQVTLVHRRETLRASRIMQDRLLAVTNIDVAWNSAVHRLQGEQRLEKIVLQDTRTGAFRDHLATGLFVAIGHDPRSDLITGQVDVDDGGYVIVEGRSSQTNAAGVFACGDLIDHSYRQAITAAGSGCTAALDVERYLSTLGDRRRSDGERVSLVTNR